MHAMISNVVLRKQFFLNLILKILFFIHTGLFYLLYVISTPIENCPVQFLKLCTGQFIELSFRHFIIFHYDHASFPRTVMQAG